MNFREAALQKKGCAMIFCGSDSDRAHVEKIASNLKKYGILYEVRICSAHKQPEKLMSLIREYNELNVPAAIIAVAGKTDALSGTVSFHSMYPVISCPPDPVNMSSITNPPGSSNAYIAEPGNAARFVAQMFACINPQCADVLKQSIDKKIHELEAKDSEILKTGV